MRFSGLPIELNDLEKMAREFKEKHHLVVDIVLYGSTAQGKENPNDFDFMLMLKNADESERFDLAFEFREHLIDMGFPHERLDVKAINLEQLWDPNYLAVPGIIITGYSLTRGRPVHELMNGEGYALFTLNLRGMGKNEKNKFSFALRGRDGRGGILKECNGIYLAPWVILVPVECTYRLKEFLRLWGVNYELYLMFGVWSESKRWELEGLV
jgi:predicted nucleotidyltransferase